MVTLRALGTRRDEVVKLRQAGLTYAEIGRRFGISKERVRQILKPKPISQKPALQSKILLRTGEVGQLLGVHVNTVRRLSQKGILKSYRIGTRGDRRFRREDVDAVLKEGCSETRLTADNIIWANVTKEEPVI